MRPIDAQQKIREAVPALNAELMMGKLKEFSRFGLPGASSSDGRGGEPPLPLLGRTDRSVLRDRNLYSEYLVDAAVALDRAVRLQQAWCVPRTDDTEKSVLLTPEAGKPCSNLWCLHVCSGKKDDVLRNGRCPACAKYFKRSGVERPRELCDVTNAQVVPATGTGGTAA